MSTYVLDDAAEQTGQRFASLEACYDPVTTRQLQAIGVAAGWSCLEVGAGNGSIARWLADRAAPEGHVVATDINPRWIDAGHPNIELRRHDIVSEELERDTFDLAHARLVLSHLPDRDRALRRMIDSLKPGGWLLIEDFDAYWLSPMAIGKPAEIAFADKVLHAFRQVLEQSGVDLGYGRRCATLLRERGLIDVHVDAHIEIADGGSPGARLMRSNVEQLRERLTGLGLISGRDLRCYCELLENPDFSFSLPPMVGGRGRRAPEMSARRHKSG
jgi:SAM-dependent methyltransferase